MGREEVVAILREHYEELVERFDVMSLKLFGSLAREEARAESDIDLLVDFGGPAGFDQYMGLLFHLEELLSTSVDLVTVRGLREELRPAIEREAVLVA